MLLLQETCLYLQGAWSRFAYQSVANEAMAFRWDEWSDQPLVPAKLKFELLTKLLHCTVVAIYTECHILKLHASEPSSDFRRNHIADSIMIFWHIFAEIMSPTNFGSFWETIAETLFWIFNMLVKTLWTLVLTTFDNIGCPTSFSRSTSCGSFINLTI